MKNNDIMKPFIIHGFPTTGKSFVQDEKLIQHVDIMDTDSLFPDLLRGHFEDESLSDKEAWGLWSNLTDLEERREVSQVAVEKILREFGTCRRPTVIVTNLTNLPKYHLSFWRKDYADYRYHLPIRKEAGKSSSKWNYFPTKEFISKVESSIVILGRDQYIGTFKDMIENEITRHFRKGDR